MAAITVHDAVALAHRLQVAGQPDKAAQVCKAILAQDARQCDALALLGVLSLQSGDMGMAAAYLEKAISLRPASAELYSNLAPAYQSLGKVDEAIAACRKAIELAPDTIGAYQNLAQALHARLRFEEEEACCRTAISLDPQYAPAYNSLALALQCQNRPEEAEGVVRRALGFAPDFPQAWSTLGMVLMDLGRIADAIPVFEKAIELRRDLPTAHYNLSMALLLSGDLPRGLAEYEWRWKCRFYDSLNWKCPLPQWDGSPLEGKTLLIYAEQGFGDAMQFVRYVPQIAARGGRVVIACAEVLQRLLARVEGVHRVMSVNDPIDGCDFQFPLMSAPLLFGTTIESVPSRVPYLSGDANDLRKWKTRMDRFTGLKVGLAWAGSSLHGNDQNRSMDFNLFSGLVMVPGPQWFSLQKARATSNAPFAEGRLIDYTPELDDFADTAALVSHLDLVITVDTAVAHLAGALGKPVWVLLPYASDWRWLRDRPDTPWYPTMRLFRQPARGDWNTVLAEVRSALEAR